MSNKFTQPNIQPSKSGDSYSKNNIPGKITALIGSGKPAQEAIVWRTIQWSFVAAGILSVLVLVKIFFFSDGGQPFEQLERIWSIFIPVITLALGYIFGKGES